MTFVHPTAKLALEWFRASGERTPARLDALVLHFAFTNAINDPETLAEIDRQARENAGFASKAEG